MKSVRAVLAVRPEADPDNVRHTLILLEQSPLERLRRSLTRGRAVAQPKLINSEREPFKRGARPRITRIDADKRAFASVAIRVIRGYILRSAE
jgi:hypothetical protein